jgi:hypothetical protein
MRADPSGRIRGRAAVAAALCVFGHGGIARGHRSAEQAELRSLKRVGRARAAETAPPVPCDRRYLTAANRFAHSRRVISISSQDG